MIKLKSGNIIGKDQINNALEKGIINSNKKFHLILKHIYPTLLEFSFLNFDSTLRKNKIVVTMSYSPSVAFYYQIKFKLRKLYTKILRRELKRLGLGVS